MKQCIDCQTCETVKWYSGPRCRKCYRKLPHVKESELRVAKISCKRWRDRNKEYCSKKNNEWVELNKQHVLEYQKKYRMLNKSKKHEYSRNRRSSDIQVRIADNLRNRLNIALKNSQRRGSAIKDLGCSLAELRAYLESRFLPGMTWNNWGRSGWHIDHVKPLAKFNLTDPVELKEACNYKNLQPLWAKDNLRKGTKYEQC